MPSLSVLIGGTSACTVLLVATITLSVTLTFSLEALRTEANKHTEALVALAQVETEHYFTRPMRGAMGLRKHLVGDGAGPFSSPNESHTPIVLSAALAAKISFDVSLPADLYGVWLDDGSSVLCYPMPDGGLSMTTNVVRNGSVTFTRDDVFLRNGTRAPPGTPAYLGGPADYRFYFAPGGWITGILDDLVGAPPEAAALDPPYVWVLDPGTPRQSELWASGWAMVIKEADGTVRGITFASVNLDALKKFLVAAKGTPNTAVFVVDALGHLVEGSPETPVKNLTIVAPGTAPPPNCYSTELDSTVLWGGPVFHGCRHHMRDFAAFPPLQAFATMWAAPGANFTNVVRTELAGSTFFVAALPISPPETRRGRLEVVVLLPEADIIGGVFRGRDIAIAVAAAVLLAAVTLSFGVAHVLLRPLRDVSARVRAAAELEKDDAPREESHINEVRELQRSYYALSDELERLAAFVPQSVLAARKRRSSDDESSNEAGDDGDVSTPQNGTDDSDGLVRSATRGSSLSGSGRRRAQRRRENREDGAVGAGSSAIDTAAGSSAGTGLNLGVSIARRAIAVVCFDSAGFHRLVDGTAPETLQSRYTAFVAAVVAAAEATRGVLDAWNGDRVMLSFNAARPVAQAGRRAVQAGLRLVNDAAVGTLGLCGFAGVASGSAQVGNLGCAGTMRFVTISTAVTVAAALSRRARLYAADDVASCTATRACVPAGNKVAVAGQALLADIQSHFVVRPVDFAAFAPAVSTAEHVVVAEVLGEIDDNADDEWLYVVGKGVAAGVEAKVFEMLQKRQFGGATAAIAQAGMGAADVGPVLLRVLAALTLADSVELSDAVDLPLPPRRRSEAFAFPAEVSAR